MTITVDGYNRKDYLSCEPADGYDRDYVIVRKFLRK